MNPCSVQAIVYKAEGQRATMTTNIYHLLIMYKLVSQCCTQKS